MKKTQHPYTFTCPVCGRSNHTFICENCGFDESQNYEKYPSPVPIPAGTKSIRSRKTEYSNTVKESVINQPPKTAVESDKHQLPKAAKNQRKPPIKMIVGFGIALVLCIEVIIYIFTGQDDNSKQVSGNTETSSINTNESEITASGIFEDGLTWTLINDTLILSGNGRIYLNRPAENYEDEVKYIIMGSGDMTLNAFIFHYYPNLRNFSVDDGNTNYSSENGVLFNKDKTTLVGYPIGRDDSSYTIPDGTTRIGDYAFSGSTKLLSITIPNGVEEIGDNAFDECVGLTTINIPESTLRIGKYAFWNCYYLTNIIIPYSVTSIEDSAFGDCQNLANISVDDGNTKYSSENGVLFNKDKTTLIKYPAGREDSSYTIPDSTTKIGRYSFFRAKLISVSIPGGVKSIESSAFAYCESLTTINIPESISTISSETFKHCTKLASITIPGSVTDIKQGAFTLCNNLAEVTFQGDAPEIYKDIFLASPSSDNTLTCYYPANNSTWNASKLQDYGGRNVNWVSYNFTQVSSNKETTTASAL